MARRSKKRNSPKTMSNWVKNYAWSPNPDSFSDFGLTDFDFKVARTIFCDGFESIGALAESLEWRFRTRVDARAVNQALARLRHHHFLVGQELTDDGHDLAIDYRLANEANLSEFEHTRRF